MLIEKKGDLLASDCNVIIHCCNCFNTMGAGIAKAIAKKYPEAKKADDDTIRGDRGKLGSFSWARGKSGVIVINLYGQYRYGRDRCHLDYDALRKGLSRAYLFLTEEADSAFLKIGTYRLGCGLAGGDWVVVKQILEDSFKDETVHVWAL